MSNECIRKSGKRGHCTRAEQECCIITGSSHPKELYKIMFQSVVYTLSTRFSPGISLSVDVKALMLINDLCQFDI